jgi:hypothetical protein
MIFINLVFLTYLSPHLELMSKRNRGQRKDSYVWVSGSYAGNHTRKPCVLGAEKPCRDKFINTVLRLQIIVLLLQYLSTWYEISCHRIQGRAVSRFSTTVVTHTNIRWAGCAFSDDGRSQMLVFIKIRPIPYLWVPVNKDYHDVPSHQRTICKSRFHSVYVPCDKQSSYPATQRQS